MASQVNQEPNKPIVKTDDGYKCMKCGFISEKYEGWWAYEGKPDGFAYGCTAGDDIECICGNEWHMDCAIFDADVKSGKVQML